jgi:hypothetical protein
MNEDAETSEACGGIRELADRLTSKLDGFVEWGPDNAAVTKALPVHLRALVRSLADKLEAPGEHDEIAGIVFDILMTLDAASEDFASIVGHVKKLRDCEKAEPMHLATAERTTPRDGEIYRLAREKWQKHPASRHSPTATAKAIVAPVNAWIAARHKEANRSGEPEEVSWDAVRQVLRKPPQSWRAVQVSS